MDEELQRLIEDHENLVLLYFQQFDRQVRLREVEDLKVMKDSVSLDVKLVADATRQIRDYPLPQDQKDKIKLYVQEKEVKRLETLIINSDILGECVTCRHLSRPGDKNHDFCYRFEANCKDRDMPCFAYAKVDYSKLSNEEIDAIEVLKEGRKQDLKTAKEILKETKVMMKQRYG